MSATKNCPQCRKNTLTCILANYWQCPCESLIVNASFTQVPESACSVTYLYKGTRYDKLVSKPGTGIIIGQNYPINKCPETLGYPDTIDNAWLVLGNYPAQRTSERVYLLTNWPNLTNVYAYRNIDSKIYDWGSAIDLRKT